MLSRSVADQVGAAKEAPRSHAYRWSSDKQPRTRPSGGSWCYEGWSAPSPKLGADIRCIASVSVSPIHKHFGCRSEDTQTHPATGRRPGIFDKPLRWRTATEIRARFSETSGAAFLTLQLVVCSNNRISMSWLGNSFNRLQYTYTGYMYPHAPEYPRKHPPPGQSDRRPSRWD